MEVDIYFSSLVFCYVPCFITNVTLIHHISTHAIASDENLTC